MRRRALKLLVSALMVLGASGCVESARVGAPNTQAHEWPETRTARSYDVIANDTNSCVRPGSEQRDPMPVRVYCCPGKLPEGTRVAMPR
jgi:hypothetical protein